MKKLILLLLLFASQIITANNLNITNVQKVSDTELSFDISWDNSWNSGGFHDAVWVFIKAKDNAGIWRHVDITSVWGTGLSPSAVPTDQKGFFVMRTSTGAGTSSGTINFNFVNAGFGPFPDFKVFGVEMVYINEGAFYVGDGDGSNFSFQQGDDPNLPYHIQSAGEITVGNTSSDLKAFSVSNNIPATYPNGYNSFYIMKYEITQQQYVEFLNTLTVAQQQNRTESDLANISSANRFVMSETNTVNSRNGIACNSNATNTTPIAFYCDLNNNEIGNENDDGQNLNCNYLSLSDIMAYTDWIALRPATEFEYEKTCRGFAYPIIDEYANGTTIISSKGSTINSGMPNETYTNVGNDGLIDNFQIPTRVGGFATSTTTRLQSGAGYFGNMELSGNSLEYFIKASDFNFNGILGDGELDLNGIQNNWVSFSSLSSRGAGAGIHVSDRGNASSITSIARFGIPRNIRACR